jgi:hypothetical protein
MGLWQVATFSFRRYKQIGNFSGRLRPSGTSVHVHGKNDKVIDQAVCRIERRGPRHRPMEWTKRCRWQSRARQDAEMAGSASLFGVNEVNAARSKNSRKVQGRPRPPFDAAFIPSHRWSLRKRRPGLPSTRLPYPDPAMA